MTKELKELLTRLLNTLTLISTKGEDTLLMADCLTVLRQIIDKTKIINSEEEKAE